jgi:Domain of unknown function (DUF4412)
MRLLLVGLTLFATVAEAKDFEGVITGKSVSTDPSKAGIESMVLSLSPTGVRTETTIGTGQPGAGMHAIMVWSTSDPNTAYILNPATKTYLKQDVSKGNDAAGAAQATNVEKLGKATFLGHTVEKVRVTTGSLPPREYWVDTSLRFPTAAMSAFSMGRSTKSGVWAALEKAGVVGIPLRDVNAEGTSGWEATSVEQKHLSSSTFQVPSDYHEGKSALDMLSPSQQAAMQQKLNSMTPEQRAKLEEMMKNSK